ncbi:MAG: glycosyltransferase [Deltaproteobacteria bacterium]|nr:glycosyltransferase [Deltaproteobacteria bacterium]
MAQIICISKYPPLEGGIAAKTYWLCRALAERGHTVHVVTDGENIDADYCSPAFQDQGPVNNLHIHHPQEKIPWHIPNDPHRSFALLNLALEVVDRHGADVIDTGYLIPYGLVGCLAGQMTGLPFLLRHGGSDLNKFLDKGIWANLIKKALKGAGAVITDRKHYGGFYGLSKRVISIPPYVPDPAFFKPVPRGRAKPTLALIGKANYHWRHKGWHRAVEIIKSLGDRFRYLIVSQGVGFKDFKKYVEDRIGSVIEWKEFVRPVEMPRVLQSVSGIFVLQYDLPFPSFSNLVVEALYCDITVITDSPNMVQSLNECGLNIDVESRHVLVIPNDSPDESAKKIINHFDRPHSGEIGMGHKESDYSAYLKMNEEAICEK